MKNKAIAQPNEKPAAKWVTKNKFKDQERKEFDKAMAERPLYE